MTSSVLLVLLAPAVPTLVLLAGGQWMLDIYGRSRKQREQETELAAFVRQQQYQAVEEVYKLFATFMALYREVNDTGVDLQDADARGRLLQRAIEAEAQTDALILRIGCEFVDGVGHGLGAQLGHLRQSAQLWRECISAGERLPFRYSNQPDYVEFKESFSHIAAFMVARIHGRLGPPQSSMERASAVVLEAFDNKYESERSKSLRQRREHR